MGDLSIYVHIPYCIKRCGYCDFNTYTPSELQDGATLEIVSADYIDAVVQELQSAQAHLFQQFSLVAEHHRSCPQKILVE